MDFIRQTRIFNPEECNMKIIVLGAGSTGSFTAFTLAKMGVKNIEVIDFDIVEKHNIPNQYYRLQDVGKLKVEALKEIIKEFTGTEINTIVQEIDKDTTFDADLNTIIINCLDNIETRKIVSNILNDLPIKMIDTRFGGEGYSIHLVDFSDEESIKQYNKSLEVEIKETGCGEKAIIYTINSLASEVCNIIKKIQKSEEVPKILRRELKTYRFIMKNKCKEDK